MRHSQRTRVTHQAMARQYSIGGLEPDGMAIGCRQSDRSARVTAQQFQGGSMPVHKYLTPWHICWQLHQLPNILVGPTANDVRASATPGMQQRNRISRWIRFGHGVHPQAAHSELVHGGGANKHSMAVVV
jgi:hypothetical protein